VAPAQAAHVLTDDGVWSIAPTLHDRSYVAAFVYDPLRDRIILFGGYGEEIRILGDTWKEGARPGRCTSRGS
jgi:hypothetical protein